METMTEYDKGYDSGWKRFNWYTPSCWEAYLPRSCSKEYAEGFKDGWYKKYFERR